jgi:hypothetical protein
MNALTAGQLLDIVSRARSVIEVYAEDAMHLDEHALLLGELREIESLTRSEINASHMGVGADVVLLTRGDV